MAEAAVAIGIFFCSSPLLTWVNKAALLGTSWTDSLALVGWQQGVTGLVLALWTGFSCGPILSLETLCVAVCFSLQLCLTNMCLAGSSLAAYQCIRTTGLIFAALTKPQRVTRREFAALIAVAAGFLIGTLDPAAAGHRQPTGNNLVSRGLPLVAGVLGSAAGVLYMNQLRSILLARQSETKVVCAVALVVSLLLSPFVLRTKLPLGKPAVWIGGLVAPLMPVATSKALKHMSPMGCIILGLLKSTVQTAVGSMIFGHELTGRCILGVALCIGGNAMYYGSRAKKKE